MKKTPQQILTEAADLLEKEELVKWGQGRYFWPSESFSSSSPACVVCAHGAIAYCADLEIQSMALVDAIKADSTYIEKNKAHSIAKKAGLYYGFNDFPGRTKQEVIDKLREAANLSST